MNNKHKKQYILYRDTIMRSPNGEWEREAIGIDGEWVWIGEDGNNPEDIEALLPDSNVKFYDTFKEAHNAWREVLKFDKYLYEAQQSYHDRVNAMTQDAICKEFVKELKDACSECKTRKAEKELPYYYLDVIKQYQWDQKHNKKQEEYKWCKMCYDNIDDDGDRTYPHWEGAIGIYEVKNGKLGELVELSVDTGNILGTRQSSGASN